MKNCKTPGCGKQIVGLYQRSRGSERQGVERHTGRYADSTGKENLGCYLKSALGACISQQQYFLADDWANPPHVRARARARFPW